MIYLEVYIKVQTNEKRQVEEGLRESEERCCFWQENTLQSTMTRNMELEGHVSFNIKLKPMIQ